MCSTPRRHIILNRSRCGSGQQIVGASNPSTKMGQASGREEQLEEARRRRRQQQAVQKQPDSLSKAEGSPKTDTHHRSWGQLVLHKLQQLFLSHNNNSSN